MYKQHKKQLIIFGLLFISSTQIISRFTILSNFLNGALFGTGIGLLILAVIKKQPLSSN